MKRTISVLYCILFLVCILLPLFFLNTDPTAISTIDNRKMAQLPANINTAFFKGIESYFNDRLGFREEAITLYQRLNDRFFSILEHPLYMRGQNGHIFYSGSEYIRDYQNTATDTQYLQAFSEYLNTVRVYCEDRGIHFLFVLLPDKKTIYPEYFPVGYNIKNGPSRTDILLGLLSKTKLDYLYPKKEFLLHKSSEVLYNVQFDVEHWNANGEFLGNSMIIDRLRTVNSRIPSIKREDYIVSSELRTSLHTSKFPISELVPVYEPKTWFAKDDSDSLASFAFINRTRYHLRFFNTASASKERLLLIGDSYMQSAYKYYVNAFEETTFLHQVNLPRVREVLDALKPDIFVLEIVERALPPRDYFTF